MGERIVPSDPMSTTPPRGVTPTRTRTLALPSSVEIYNVMGEQEDAQPQLPDASAEAKHSIKRPASAAAAGAVAVPWSRPPHSVELLHRVRLEIHVTDAFVSKTLYSQATVKPRIHATWKHIEEAAEEPSVTLHEGESLWLSFFLEGGANSGAQDDTPNAAHDVDTNDTFPHPFLRVSLEKLVSVSQEIDTNVLPVNAVILKYPSHNHNNKRPTSNALGGSPPPSSASMTATTRIPISLHEVLAGHSLLKEPVSSTSPVAASGLFDDGVFDTLDSVLPSPARPRIESLGGLADLSAASRAPDIYGTSHALMYDSVVHDNGVFDPPAPADAIESDQIMEEHCALKAMLQLEEQALQRELEQLRRGLLLLEDAAVAGSTVTLLDLCQSAAAIDRQSREVRQATVELQLEAAKSRFLLEAQQIRIVRDLSLLFPILAPSKADAGPDGNYRIRGLQLPNSAQGVWQGPNPVPEDEVSAALGWTVHVLLCLGRYLSIEMRHPLGFQSSRSYVQDANTNTYYPLFTIRQDRDKFVAGWELLETNVDRVLLELRLPRSRSLPLLARIHQVYDAVIVGS